MGIDFGGSGCPLCGAYLPAGNPAHFCPDGKDYGGTTFGPYVSTAQPETLKEIGNSVEEIIAGERALNNSPLAQPDASHFGPESPVPSLETEVAELRAEIQQLKTLLRAWLD